MPTRLLPLLAICLLCVPHTVYPESLQQEVIRIAPYGNSITQAAGDHDSYRYPLWKKLVDAEIPFDFVGSMNRNWNNVDRAVADYKGQQFDKDHEGHWGWRADEILGKYGDNMEMWLNEYTPDMVLLHIGTNDCIQGNDLNSTMNEIKQIIANLRDDNPEVVIFLSNLIPCSIANKINEINGRIETLPRELTTETSPVIFVDQFDGFISGGDQYDGIHPNPAGEEKMAQKWFEAITNYLNSTGVKNNVAVDQVPRYVKTAGHRTELFGLQRSLENKVTPFQKRSISNLLGKKVAPAINNGSTGQSVYIILDDTPEK